jgi:solute carrier family 25 (mitochondrial carnitine/acylcarnitine transporter), member 20/29
LYFGVYEVAKQQAAAAKGGKPSSMDFLFAGAMGGVAYWLFTYPLDVIKSAMQTDAIMPAERKYKSYMDCTRKVRTMSAPLFSVECWVLTI